MNHEISTQLDTVVSRSTTQHSKTAANLVLNHVRPVSLTLPSVLVALTASLYRRIRLDNHALLIIVSFVLTKLSPNAKICIIFRRINAFYVLRPFLVVILVIAALSADCATNPITGN